MNVFLFFKKPCNGYVQMWSSPHTPKEIRKFSYSRNPQFWRRLKGFLENIGEQTASWRQHNNVEMLGIGLQGSLKQG